MTAPYYEADGITLYCGDCREVRAWLEADVLVTDPPYGIAYTSTRPSRFQHHRIAGDEDTALRDDALEAWGPTRPAAVFGSWKRPRPDGVRALLTWDKGEAVGAGDLDVPWRPNTEEIYVLGQGWHGHRGSSILRDTSVLSWSGSRWPGARQHPTEKPVPLLRQLIAKAPAGVVADPFAGSGSTLRAAKDLGRQAIGVEIDEAYCEVAVRRLAQMVLPV